MTEAEEVVEEVPAEILNDVDAYMEALLLMRATENTFEKEAVVGNARHQIELLNAQMDDLREDLKAEMNKIAEVRMDYAQSFQEDDDRMAHALNTLRESWVKSGWEVGRTTVVTRQGDEVEIEKKVTKSVKVDDVGKMASYLLENDQVEKGFKEAEKPFVAAFIRKVLEAADELGLEIPPGMAHMEEKVHVYVRPQEKEVSE